MVVVVHMWHPSIGQSLIRTALCRSVVVGIHIGNATIRFRHQEFDWVEAPVLDRCGVSDRFQVVHQGASAPAPPLHDADFDASTAAGGPTSTQPNGVFVYPTACQAMVCELFSPLHQLPPVGERGSKPSGSGRWLQTALHTPTTLHNVRRRMSPESETGTWGRSGCRCTGGAGVRVMPGERRSRLNKTTDGAVT